jgi:hypothetical protein
MFNIMMSFPTVGGISSPNKGASSTSSSSLQRDLVVNGITADPTDYQFFARSWPDHVQMTGDMLCGASLIHSDILLTAAHCHGAFNYGLMLYNPDTKKFNRFATVDRQISYPEYYVDVDSINFDIMILRLSEPVADIAPVMVNNDPDFPVPGQDVGHAAGFGLTDPDLGTIPNDLQVGYFKALSNSQCLLRGRFINVDIEDDVMCVDPQDDDSVCGGDSGGPLTVPLVEAQVQSSGGTTNVNNNSPGLVPNAIQIGVVSFGTDCKDDSIPDGFARVSHFSDWIQDQICQWSRNPPAGCPDTETPEVDFLYQDAVEIEINFHHDFLAEETTFAIRNTLNNKIEYVGPQYVPRRGEQVASTLSLFAGNYAFEVYDSAGDGLHNPDCEYNAYSKSTPWCGCRCFCLAFLYSCGVRIPCAGLVVFASAFVASLTLLYSW